MISFIVIAVNLSTKEQGQLPVHVTPSPRYPALQAQVKLPSVSVHVAMVAAQLSVSSAHSSISEMRERFFKEPLS